MIGKRILLAVALGSLLMVSALPNQTAQSAVHPVNACSAPYHIQSAGWDFCWQQDNPRAQGLELNQVYYRGESVLWKLGVPFSMTKYDNALIGPFKDTLGSPGSGGHPGYGLGALTIPSGDCPRFLGTGTLLNGGRLCVEERGGPEPAVAIWARFNIFNYRFIQGYQLDDRGHIEPFVRMGGLLIDGNGGANSNNHFHQLIWRADFDIGADGNDQFQVYSRNHGAGPLTGSSFPANTECELDGLGGTAGWCTMLNEGTIVHQSPLYMKYRVKDTVDTNSMGRDKSFEFRLSGGDGTADAFSTFDVMAVQYKGDSSELGYEVPTNPREGDKRLYQYVAVQDVMDDPVVWMVLHAYHDTRDEDRGSMSYHEVHPEILPHNFHGANPGEDTYP